MEAREGRLPPAIALPAASPLTHSSAYILKKSTNAMFQLMF